MYVIGTAGHVDHGKSSLIQALTGIHPDRLKEEREREMTIDLGFAWLELPNGEEIGIVDVPGHRDFIENMLAGIGGIDAVLFVVAADEGVMPQTREHLAILDLLQINSGVVALTKIDLVEPEWLELVQEDLRFTFIGTVLEDAAIIPVSSRTQQGLDALLGAITRCLENRSSRPNLGRPRLPVDRVFSIAGFGTVVTGTLSDGALKIGDELEILPTGFKGRVRGLQTHKRKEEIAAPGSRTAINIAGIQMVDLHRGDVIAHPGDYAPTRRLDVRCRILPSAAKAIKHNIDVKLFIGTAEVLARVRLLGQEELPPGETGWIQLETNSPVVAVRGDHFILRRPSPGETLGGGSVLEPHPKGRHKRFSETILARFEALSQGTPPEIFLEAAQALGVATLKEVAARSNLDPTLIQPTVEELISAELIITLEQRPSSNAEANLPGPGDFILAKSLWDQITARVLQEIHNFHLGNPLKTGMPREELKSRLKSTQNATPKLINAIIASQVVGGQIEENNLTLREHGFKIRFTAQQGQTINQLIARFKNNPYSPPSVKECQAAVGEDLFQALLETGVLVELNQEVVFRKEDYDEMIKEIRNLISQSGQITAAQVRDHFNTSRKYALAMLEHMDVIGITIRLGDFRRLQG